MKQEQQHTRDTRPIAIAMERRRSTSPGAVRMTRLRERRQQGFRVYQIEVSDADLDALSRAGFSTTLNEAIRPPSNVRSVRFSIGSACDALIRAENNEYAIRATTRITGTGVMTDSIYTPALTEAICKRLSEGESLRAICRDPGMPTEGAVRAWARDNRDGFGVKYRIARELQLDFRADEIVAIAGEEQSDPRSRQVRIETRKWIMSKLAPRRYGDRLLVAGEPENPIWVLHEQVNLDRLTPEQLEALENFAQAMLQKQREPA